MEIPAARERAADADAADAVALAVEPRRKDADAELAGEDGDDAAGDAAFRRHAHVVEPLARVVVHAAGAHDAEHALDVFAADGLLAGERIDAAVGERGGHDGEVAAVAEDGALLEVGLDDGHRVAGEDVEVAQHVADGAVAMAGGALGGIDLLVDRQSRARRNARTSP